MHQKGLSRGIRAEVFQRGEVLRWWWQQIRAVGGFCPTRFLNLGKIAYELPLSVGDGSAPASAAGGG